MGNKLKNMVCLITGGTRGIGKATAIELSKLGATVVITYNSDKTNAEKTKNLIGGISEIPFIVQLNISNDKSVKIAIDKIINKFGRLDVLVNNAGQTYDGAFASMDAELYEKVISTNLIGTIKVSMTCLPYLKKSKGKIVIVSSLASISGKEGQTPYSASKGGLNGFTRILARKVGEFGVRVNAIAPGFINTEMVSSLPESTFSHVVGSSTIKRIGEPEEVAKLIAFLVGEDSSYINASILRIDGGYNR
ncbi:3-oxoacyl-[acyl-carrier protein] reductase (EC 1.1.1.100) [uncultured Gammaproteobacteria bacterium]|nr:3-oxoacyl-[acyl-carrier protein] reductase (EC 1.1.1.100) [uncultured Gammaproteobacteria bacterium]